jgi:hypothetical protein
LGARHLCSPSDFRRAPAELPRVRYIASRVLDVAVDELTHPLRTNTETLADLAQR